MNKGSQGTAELYDSTPPGLVSERKLQGTDTQKDGMSFWTVLSNFILMNGTFLNHFSYLFITKTTKERSRSQSNFSILCRGI